jgi:hypothetical protein
MSKKPFAGCAWLFAVCMQICAAGAVQAAESNSRSAVSEEESHGIPVVEGGSSRPMPVKPGPRGTMPSQDIEVQPSAQATPLHDAARNARLNAKLRLDVKSGTQEFESWVDYLETEPTSLQFRWSSQPALGTVMWVVLSCNCGPFIWNGDKAVVPSNSILHSGFTSQKKFGIDLTKPPVSAAMQKDYWIGIIVVDEKKQPLYTGNPQSPTVQSNFVRISFQEKKSQPLMGACSSDKECRSGEMCASGMCAQKTNDTPRVDYCITYKVIERVNKTTRDCAPYICKGPGTPYPPKGTPGAECTTTCNSAGSCAMGWSCEMYQCVKK